MDNEKEDDDDVSVSIPMKHFVDMLHDVDPEELDPHDDDAYMLDVIAPEHTEDDDDKKKEDHEELDEARILSIPQRIKLSQRMRRLSKRYATLRKLKAKRMAPNDRLRYRARKAALMGLRRRVAGDRGQNYNELSRSQKISIDQMVARKFGNKLPSMIGKIATRLLPIIRRKETGRLAKARGTAADTKKVSMPIFAGEAANTIHHFTRKGEKDDPLQTHHLTAPVATKDNPKHSDTRSVTFVGDRRKYYLKALEDDVKNESRFTPRENDPHDSRYRRLRTFRLRREELEQVDEARKGKAAMAGGEEGEGGDTGIIYQLRKHLRLRGDHEIRWEDGTKSKIPMSHSVKALNMYDKIMSGEGKGHFAADKQKFVKRLGKSHDSFHSVLRGEPEKKHPLSAVREDISEKVARVPQDQMIIDPPESIGPSSVGRQFGFGPTVFTPSEARRTDTWKTITKILPHVQTASDKAAAAADRIKKQKEQTTYDKQVANENSLPPNWQEPQIIPAGRLSPLGIPSNYQAEVDKSATILKAKQERERIALKLRQDKETAAAKLNAARRKVNEALVEKAEKNNIDYTILEEVYNRGIASCPESYDEQRWAFNRVNSFIAGGYAAKLDADLIEAVKEPTGGLKDACWKGYTAVGFKTKNGKRVPNCVPKEGMNEDHVKVGDNVHLGFGTKGGAGFKGKVTKIEGDTIHIQNPEGKTYKGPHKLVTKEGLTYTGNNPVMHDTLKKIDALKKDAPQRAAELKKKRENDPGFKNWLKGREKLNIKPDLPEQKEVQIREDHSVLVDDDGMHLDDKKHVLAGLKKYKGTLGGVTDKGPHFTFPSPEDAEQFKKHVNNSPKKTISARIVKSYGEEVNRVNETTERVADIKRIKVKMPDGRVVWRNERKPTDVQQEQKKEDLPFEPDDPKKIKKVTPRKGPQGELVSRVRHLARQAIKNVKESFTNNLNEVGGAGFTGTDELRKKYASDTPGQTPETNVAHFSADKPWVTKTEEDKHDSGKTPKTFQQVRDALSGKREIKESFTPGIPDAPFAHELGIKAIGGFAHHPTVEAQLESDHCCEECNEESNLINENVYRVGSEMYFEYFNEKRRLYNEGKLQLNSFDAELLKGDIGMFEEYEGNMVPLDCPMVEEEEKNPPLNQPKRGGTKKFYVYVRDPSSGNVKKVSWGDTTGLTVKMNNPAARKSFAARHGCGTPRASDRTKAAYWACNTPRYAKQLGLSGGGSFYW